MAFNTREENAADLKYESEHPEPTLQGICKDCGNGTLNNELNPAFELLASDGCDDEELRCISCGSTHLDLVAF